MTWDNYFLGIAAYVSRKSKDPSTKVGAVIVRSDQTVASIGYNGFPRGIEDNERLDNRDVKYALMIHAEMNAILNAKEPLNGYTLYTWPFASCERCCVHVIQAGIRRCVFPALPVHLEERWGASVQRSKTLFKEAGVEFVEY